MTLSPLIKISNGIGQGDPLSMIIYNADLLELTTGPKKSRWAMLMIPWLSQQQAPSKGQREYSKDLWSARAEASNGAKITALNLKSAG